MMKSNISQPAPEIKFSPTGYPLNPATGQMYSRNEIVADSSIPLPRHVDPINPPPYWQRKTGPELAAEAKRIADKNRRNQVARERNAGKGKRPKTDRAGGGFVNLATTIAMPTLTLVQRVNSDPVETFVNETSDPLATDPDETDGPRNLGESIMELNGEDYKAARRAAKHRRPLPTNAQAQAALEHALNPGRLNRAAPHKWSFGR